MEPGSRDAVWFAKLAESAYYGYMFKIGLTFALFGLALAGCSAAAPPEPTAVPTLVMSSAPPTQIRCIMGEQDRTVLIVIRSTPALIEQNALNDVCTPGGRMGPTWIPQSLIAPMDDYALICQGGINATQVVATIWAIKSDATAPSRAYNGCHALSNVTYPVTP